MLNCRPGWSLLIALISLFHSGFSQSFIESKEENKITGVITNSSGRPVSAASIVVSDTLNGRIIAYGITNEKGVYNIQLPSSPKVLLIQVKAMGYAFEMRTIANKSGEYNFILLPKPAELPAVTVKPSAITQKGDTLNYLVSAFADSKDRSIADVLAKMPGIEVTSEGKVLYLGKAIQKYYIEGMDLLEGRYNLANQSLPHLSVSSVQILENHQPIRILDSLVPSSQASINIKLKNSITTTGSGRVGLGAQPFLWDAGITPMVFKKAAQFISSYQANNTGNDVSRQLKSLTIENLRDQLDLLPALSSILRLVEASTPPVASKRYLDNNVHLLTGNALTRLSSQLELRINASYLNDAQKRYGETTTTFFTPQGDVLLRERIANQYFSNELNTQFTLQQNTPKGYLKNMLSIGLGDNLSKGIVNSNDDSIVQRLETPLQNFSNQLRWITPVGKQLVTFVSNMAYTKSPAVLQVSPGPFPNLLTFSQPYDLLHQQFDQTSWSTHHYADLTIGWKRWTFNPRLGIQTSYLKKESAAETGKPNMSEKSLNDLSLQYTRSYASASFTYQQKAIDLTISIPLSAYRFNIQDAIKDSSNLKRFWAVDPVVYANIKFNSTWRLNVMAAYQNAVDNFNQIFTGLVVDNYRSIRTNNLPIAQTKISMSSIGLNYRNPMHSVFSHIQYQYQNMASPFLLANRIESDGSKGVVAIVAENEVHNHSVQARASKYFTTLKTTFSIGANFGYAQTNQIIDGKITRSINTNVSPNAKINTRIGSWFALEYDMQMGFAQNELKGVSKNKFNIFKFNANLHFYPSKHHYIGMLTEYFSSKTLGSRQSIFYPDLIYRYTLSKRKLDLEVSLMNLLNQQTYITPQFTDFYFYKSEFQIRPRQIVVSAKFQF